jgi:hypothetical protein
MIESPILRIFGVILQGPQITRVVKEYPDENLASSQPNHLDTSRHHEYITFEPEISKVLGLRQYSLLP